MVLHGAQGDPPMRYELRLMTTASATGYFAACPVGFMGFDDMLSYLRGHLMDDFMHKHLLEMVATLEVEQARQILEMARDRDPVMLTLLYEASLLYEKLAGLSELFSGEDARRYLQYTPLNFMKCSLLEDAPLHRAWIELLGRSISRHEALPSPASEQLPAPLSAEEIARAQEAAEGAVHVSDIVRSMPKAEYEPVEVYSPAETARRAIEKLERINAVATAELRHSSSLSPYGFLRRWHLALSVENGGHHYSLAGVQTSYGRGLTEDAARASYAMEMIERYSSFASFGEGRILGAQREHPLQHGSFEELEKAGIRALDPNLIGLEAPYGGEPLYWIEGMIRSSKGLSPIWAPAQCVFLFCNLDEISLFAGLGSTGLASGSTMEQAKVSALNEVIERDAEGVGLYDPARCFRIVADDPEVRGLLESFEAKGVYVRFQDISPSFGVPCYRSFIVTEDGEIIKGTGAHLNGRRALLSAMTEVPYPFPVGPPTMPPPDNLRVVRYEDLPNFSTGDPVKDLAILEQVLMANQYHPIYVDLTRADLDIPVTRAIVPGLELLADFDRFSRVSPRLYANYLRSGQRE